MGCQLAVTIMSLSSSWREGVVIAQAQSDQRRFACGAEIKVVSVECFLVWTKGPVVNVGKSGEVSKVGNHLKYSSPSHFSSELSVFTNKTC